MSTQVSIRFIPRNSSGLRDPVNRMRCFNVVAALRRKGHDADLFRAGDRPDLLVTLSLDTTQWESVYQECRRRRVPIVVDLAENEFERSARLTVRKIMRFLRERRGPREFVRRLHGFGSRSKFDRDFYHLLERSSALVACSRRIVADARAYVRHSYVIPDAVEFRHYPPKKNYDTDARVLCWLGMGNGLPFLLDINRVLQKVQRKRNLDIVLITSSDYRQLSDWAVRRFDFRFRIVPWSLETAGRHLAASDIAVAPLPSDSYKSANKVITYWAAGLPVVVSPTLEYRHVVRSGENGYIASNRREWLKSLESLCRSVELRRMLGREGCRLARTRFSPDRIASEWESVIFQTLKEPPG